ncbi:MAG: hypothetical protein IPF93_22010 [Saprospiraceae bacterium]|nr:hypothetical protein [Saprospiraceae bacterium]
MCQLTKVPMEVPVYLAPIIPILGSTFLQTHLYNRLWYRLLVDDERAQVIAGLQDITVCCDGAPGGSAYARTFCSESERFSTWPGYGQGRRRHDSWL